MEELKSKIYENNIQLKKWIDEILDDLDNNLKAFYSTIKQEKRIAINLNLESLNLVLIDREYKNIFQLGYDQKSTEARYNSNVNTLYYEKLKSFMKILDQRKQLKYGSLNIGGLGSNFPGFGSGQLAIILSKDFSIRLQEEIICLKKFSLNYFKSNLSFKEELLINESSTWKFVEILALQKHFSDIEVSSLEEWQEIISNKRGWLEILIYNRIYISDIQEIRINEELFLYFERLNDKVDLSNYETAINLTFQAILRNLKKNKIPIQPI